MQSNGCKHVKAFGRSCAEREKNKTRREAGHALPRPYSSGFLFSRRIVLYDLRRPVLDIPDVGDEVFIEERVVRYQKDGAGEFRQCALQLVLGVYVQMVGRLVENQPVVLAVHHNRQPYLGVFAAAEYAHLAGDMLVRQTALGETKPHLPVLHRRKLRPEGIQRRLLAIDPKKDVDGFHPMNTGNLWNGRPQMVPCTPAGIMEILREYNVELEGKTAVIIGRSNIVGKPMAQLLLEKNATVTLTHSRTPHLAKVCNKADVLIVAIGRAKFVTEEFVKEGAVVIDVGINRDEEGKLCGDVDFDQVKEKVSMITPVPGGVGPMTITMLMEQTYQAALRSLKG